MNWSGGEWLAVISSPVLAGRKNYLREINGLSQPHCAVLLVGEHPRPTDSIAVLFYPRQ